jgi:hypothetical protein
MSTLPIVTIYAPEFSFNDRWSAQRDGAGEEDPIGFGSTEAEAVADLFEAEEIADTEPETLEETYNRILAELTELEARAKKSAP